MIFQYPHVITENSSSCVLTLSAKQKVSCFHSESKYIFNICLKNKFGIFQVVISYNPTYATVIMNKPLIWGGGREEQKAKPNQNNKPKFFYNTSQEGLSTLEGIALSMQSRV